MEGFLESQTQKHEESEKELIASGQIKCDDESGPEANYDSHMLYLISSFEDMLRKSFFVSLYSFFESVVLNECRARKSIKENIFLDLSDLAGQNDIDKAKTYFTKVLQLDFPRSTPEWGEIQNYKTLRNCVIHAQGRIDDMRAESDQKKLRIFVANKKTLSLREYQGEVIFKKGFCEEALVTIEKFLRSWLYPNNEK